MHRSPWLNFREKATSQPRRILLADGDDARAQEAARRLSDNRIAIPLLINSQVARDLSAEDRTRYRHILRGVPKLKSLTDDEVEQRINDPLWLAALLLKDGKGDGFVGGASRTTTDTLRAIFNLIGLRPGTSTLFGFFFIEPQAASDDRELVLLADCAVSPEPSPKQLANIAIGSAEAFTFFTGHEARVAFLSFSTAGSAEHQKVSAVREAVTLAKEKKPSLKIEGEWQADAALDAFTAGVKGVGASPMSGRANVLIAPDLNTGNIAYKLVQRLGGCRAVGPVIWGMAQPANDLSRGCSVEDIVDMVALTSIQAQACLTDAQTAKRGEN